MSTKRGKTKEDDRDFAEQPAKKTAKHHQEAAADDDDESDDIVVCEISKNRRVSVRNWNGKIVVDIREFYVKDGVQLPGKKGISLGMDQWYILRDHVDKIDKAVTENS